MPSYGNNPWGSGWGGISGSTTPLTVPSDDLWDTFSICTDTEIQNLASYDGVSLTGTSAFASALGEFTICSGFAGAPTAPTAHINIATTVGASFTLEVVAVFDALPDDLLDLPNEHLFIGAQSIASSAAGIFISDDGIQYTGAIAYVAGELVVASPIVPIPGTAGIIQTGVRYIIRIIANDADGTALIYITPEASLPSTGHQLVAIVPLLTFASASPAPSVDEVIISVRSDGGTGSCATLNCIQMSSQALISNVAPIADAGDDQSVRACNVIRLDGSRSFDPEGETLTYKWRLIDAPPSSAYVFEGGDGTTTPDAPPTGFTDTFTSTEAETAHAVTPFVTGDVIVVRGVPYTISSVNIGPFELVVESAQIPDDVSSEPYKIIRQAALSGATTVSPTLFPDVAGFYLFDLLVNDGELDSSPTGLDRDSILVNVLDSPLPRGCNPNVGFIFDYLASFWKLVEDSDVVSQFWTALAQTAATELYTLWQIEYSKSLRDIQRTSIRRWLHYDLMLPEPVPDITQIKTIWFGVLSDQKSSSGVSGVAGTKLVVSTPDIATAVEVPFVAKGTVPITILRGLIENKLRMLVDDGFRVTAIENRTNGNFVFRIWLDKPFTLTSESDLPIFATYPQSNDNPKGAGSKIGDSVYDTNAPLAGLGIEEDDILVLDATGYRVVQLLDNAGDDYPYERVLLKETIVGSPAGWTLPGWVQSELLNFYAGLVYDGDVVEFETLEDDESVASSEQQSALVEAAAKGVAENRPSRLAFDTRSLYQQVTSNINSVRLARIVRRHYVPVDSDTVSVPNLSQDVVIEDDESTLWQNADYFLETFRGQNALRFQSGLTGDAGDVWEGERPPDRLWAEYTYLDNSQTIENNFGVPVGLLLDDLAELPDNVDYLSAVRGLWYVLYNGPTVRNVRIGVQILLGLPFSEEDGVIEEIRDDFLLKRGRILIRDANNPEIVRSYDYPNTLDLEINPDTGATYAVGDSVSQFAPLVEGAEVKDYVNDPTWFEGLLNQGTFYEIEKYHTFLVRVSSNAFNLSALLFARDFVDKIKPVYKYPRFLIEFIVSDDGDEINVSDTLQYNLTLNLFDNTCSEYGAAGLIDEPDPSGNALGFPAGEKSGAYANAVDYDDDLVGPTAPTPDSPIEWGVDKYHLCPANDVFVAHCEDHPDAEADIAFVSSTTADFTKTSGVWADVGIELGDIIQVTTGSNNGFTFTVTDISGFPTVFRGTIITGGPPVTQLAQTIILCPEVDSCFVVDKGPIEGIEYSLSSPASIATTGTQITAVGATTATLTGDITDLRVVFQGDQDDAQTANITAVNAAFADFAKTAGGWGDVDVQVGDIIEVTSGLNIGHRYEVTDVSGFPTTFRGLQIAKGSSGALAPTTDTGASVVNLTPRYDVYIEVNSVEQYSAEVVTVENKEFVVSGLSVAVTAGNTIDVYVRPSGGTVARTPNWSLVTASIRIERSTLWAVDTPIAAGTYCCGSQVYA